MNIRRDVFARVEGFSLAEFDRFGSASLITRSTNDVQQVQMMVVMSRMLFYAPIMGVGGIIRALDKSSSMSYIIAISVVVLLSLIISIFLVSVPRFKKIQKTVDKLNLVTRESLVGMLVIRAFNTQKHEEERFDGVNQDLTKLNLFVSRTMAFMMPVMTAIMSLTSIAIIWVGSYLIEADKLLVGDMMAFMQYAMQIIMSFLMVSMMFIFTPRAAVSGTRIAEVLNTRPSITDPPEEKAFDPSQKGVVVFDHVSFRYPGADEDVLHDVTFTARPGETTAFIGSTGSGKSTVVNLVPRFYDVTAGRVLVNGADVRSVSQKSLRDKIGYVPQKGILFTGSIADNLRYGDENADEAALKEASEIAQAMEFIGEKPEGFETPVAQGGSNVSGGQKQRLSIARALVKKPDIYIFDDSFSALDFQTDAALRHALKEKTAGATVLLVAQRISTIMNAEQIVVLDEGRVVGQGTHRELLDSCGVYREIALSQLSEEELA